MTDGTQSRGRFRLQPKSAVHSKTAMPVLVSCCSDHHEEKFCRKVYIGMNVHDKDVKTGRTMMTFSVGGDDDNAVRCLHSYSNGALNSRILFIRQH